MSFLRSEPRPPDAKVKHSKDVRRAVSPAVAQGSGAGSHIPVLERKKMFEQTDGVGERLGVGGKRMGRFSSRKGENGRTSSFRASKKIKTEDGASVVRGKQAPEPAGLWHRLKNFGHHDLQSIAIESFSGEPGGEGERPPRKKATGASAAHYEELPIGDGRFNDLVAVCPAFRNEVGGSRDWLQGDDNAVLTLREGLSHDKQKRLGIRGNLVLDGELPSKELFRQKGPMSDPITRLLQPQSGIYNPFEFIDYGASYYRNHFLGQEHQNFFGVDENLGPVAISMKRERVPDELSELYGASANITPVVSPKHQYRVVLRTCELRTLRGTILEEVIPSSLKTGSTKGLPPRDVVDYITNGELQLSSLKLGKQEKKVHQELARLDEQELNNKYKIGVLYCRKGQTTEEEMYNNARGSAAFDEFMSLLGRKVKMKGFSKYRAQLDNRTDTTGEYSVYTEFRDVEVMFHVSTLLPYTTSNRQQLLRKRHIGNDIVTVIFQEQGSEPFSPKVVRSQFQHIFIVVRVHNPHSAYTKYRVAVARSQDIPYFGPTIPENAVFDKNEQFRDFLLSKLINACNASLRNDKFLGMAVRTRRQYLTDLAEGSTTAVTIDQVNTSGIVGFLAKNWGGKKRERLRNQGPLILTPGALTWKVSIILREKRPLPFSEDYDFHTDCILGLSPDMMVFLNPCTKELLLHIPTKDIVGWLQDGNRLNMFYDNCHCLCLESFEGEDDIRDIVTRMQAISPKLSPSHEATLMEFRRGLNGLLGFGINEAGLVQKVDGVAKSIGLQTSSRLLQVEDRLVCTYSHKQIMELLTDKTRGTVRAYVIPPTPKPFRPPMYYPALNWPAIWSTRPSHGEDEGGGKVSNGTEPMQVSPVVPRRKVSSNANRNSYIEAVSEGDQFKKPDQGHEDDDDPVYDRLMTYSTGTVTLRSRSPRPGRAGLDKTVGYNRVRQRSKALRESVVQFADDLMERQLAEGRKAWTPEPVEHTVGVFSSDVQMHLSQSTSIPQLKPQMAAPLSKIPGHRRSSSEHRRPPPGSIKTYGTSPPADMPMTPGQVHELTKRFSFNPTKGAGSVRLSSSSEHGSPLRATLAAAGMTRSGIPLPSGQTGEASLAKSDIQLRDVPNKKGVKVRPMSWDASLIFSGEKNTSETAREAPETSPSFTRDADTRVPVRRRTPPTEEKPADSEPIKKTARPAMESKLPQPSSREQLSQGSSQGSSQEEIVTPVSVRERTMRWEARGGGLPSYFSTLPRSFRHRASSVAAASGPRGHALRRENTLTTLLSPAETPRSTAQAKSRHVSVGSAPGVQASRIPAPRSSLVLTSRIPVSSHARQSSLDQESLLTRSLEFEFSSGETQKDESELSRSVEEPPKAVDSVGGAAKDSEAGKRRAGQSSAPKASHLPVIKSRTVTITSVKSKGQSLLPTKTQVLGQPKTTPPGQEKEQTDSPHHTANGPVPERSTRASSIPRPAPHRAMVETAVQTEMVDGLHKSNSVTAGHNHDPVGTGVEDSLDMTSLQREVTDLSLADGSLAPPQEAGSGYTASIEDWLKEASENAVVPDALVGEGREGVSSPTPTDGSYSQMSDSQDVIDSLKLRIEYLETKLEKEAESNTELRSKLHKLEHKLHDAQAKHHAKHTISVKSAYI